MKILGKTVLVLLVFFCAKAIPALEIIYPEDGTYIVRSDFLIIKSGDSPALDGVKIEINGLKSDIIDISSEQYKAVFADFLILQPAFEFGRNEIKIDGYSGGQVVRSAPATIFYQANSNMPPPDGFRPNVMHGSQDELLCSPCHNMKPTADQLEISSSEQNPCGSCHSRMLNKKYVHGPAGVFRCVFCHDPSSRPSKYKDGGGDADVCNKCHLGKVKEFKTHKFIHGPVAAGLCSVCHDAHASDYPTQLHRPVNDLCIGCHANLNLDGHVVRGVGRGTHPLQGHPDPSRPGKELSCVSCHNPHGGASRTFFSAKYAGSFMVLCQKCHDK